MIRINLLGREAEKKARGSGFSLGELGDSGTQAGIAAMLVGVLLLLGAAWWYQSSQLADVRAELAAVEQERARLEDVAGQVESLQERTDLLRSKLMVIVDLKANQTGPVMLLDQISRLLTDGVWLTRLQLDETEVQIRGAALSEVQVADFVRNLEMSDYFSEVQLRTLGDTGEGYSFQVTLLFDATPGSPDIPLASNPEPSGSGR